MTTAGDPIQLGEQTAVLVRSYCSMGSNNKPTCICKFFIVNLFIWFSIGKMEASKQAAESAISLLSDFCIIAVMVLLPITLN